MIITFFGHRQLSENIRDKLKDKLIELIEEYNDLIFYVGYQGSFDLTVIGVLKELIVEYPQIRICVVLSYLRDAEKFKNIETIFPDVLDNIHPRFALDRRNKWMVEKSEIIICYINQNFGGAYKFVRLALKRNKTVFNLGKLEI